MILINNNWLIGINVDNSWKPQFGFLGYRLGILGNHVQNERQIGDIIMELVINSAQTFHTYVVLTSVL